MPVFTTVLAIGSAVAAVGATAAAAVGVTLAAGGIAATIAGGALIGAAIGGITAAIKGDNIFKGILKGGLIGAAAGGLLGAGAELVAAKAAPSAVAATATAPATETVAAEGVRMIAPEAVKTAVGGAAVGGGEVAKTGFLAGVFGGEAGKYALATAGLNAAAGLFAPKPVDEMALLKEKYAEDLAQRRVELADIKKFKGTVSMKEHSIDEIMAEAVDRKMINPESSAKFTSDNVYRVPEKATGSMLAQQIPSTGQPVAAPRTTATTQTVVPEKQPGLLAS